tara:strand:- start:124 stop:729 length:606 start_codon:yes stop_codon:yes gene_type:complete
MNNLLIIDWDDTIFPTTWLLQNNINIQNEEVCEKYKLILSELDIILFRFLNSIINKTKIVIVTNASFDWIKKTGRLLPNSFKLIKRNIEIISARDLYKKKYPDDAFMWKKIVFEKLLKIYFNKKLNIQNIISIGDADYEYKALINLNNYDQLIPNKRILKAIKFKKTPEYKTILEQIELLTNNIIEIIKYEDHLDLLFSDI